MTADEANLDDKATQFADKLTALTRGVLGEDSPPFAVQNVGNRIRVAPLASDLRIVRIPVRINRERCLNLFVQHLCCWDGAAKYLAVDKTEVKVFYEGSSDPLLRYEYERYWDDPPGAHLHVHAHRDEMAYLLRLADKKGRPRNGMRARRLPRLAEMHFSVGGHRMRPALEDVLLLLEREFAIDVVNGWREVLEKHLREWRILQLKSAVRDAHEDAAQTLREIGYVVTPTERVEPQRGSSRLYLP
ncbi:hypothetical protein TR631_21115 [Streptomyces rochei]|uniref:hypothetical protein n=1 Tax=Streptomyces rochei TaxID=1928 RepID=UPI002ACDB2F3|nr:hypothetical protein [Streptomyces rochei]WQC14164.1 hypothetical protein TR631_21115 [Streptomyces rochei]